MKSCIVVIAMLLTFAPSIAQTYTPRYRVHIPDNFAIARIDKLSCPERVPRGFLVEEKRMFSNSTSSYEATRSGPSRINYTKIQSVTRSIGSLGGWANLTSDEKDKSIIHVNYWLNPENEVPAGHDIEETTWQLDCAGGRIPTVLPRRTLTDAETFTMIKVEPGELGTVSAQSWFNHNTRTIVVFARGSAVPLYYLFDKYQRDADYIIQLRNRDFISFRYRSWNFGAITIPFKFRSGYQIGTTIVENSHETDLNLGVFGGITPWGRYRQRLEGNELKDLSKLSVTFGGFFGLSSTTLNKASTTAGAKPITDDKEKKLAVISTGIGGMFNIYNFQIGVFYGWDYGIGQEGKNWNYGGHGWWGLGIVMI